MRLIEAHKWAEKHFDPDSRPPEVTIMRWLRQGKLPARKVGGKWYVDEHAWLAGDDELVRRVLDAAS